MSDDETSSALSQLEAALISNGIHVSNGAMQRLLDD
jgi:hypothetical protein